MKKNIIIIAIFTAALMISMPCISAVNYNAVEHKNIDNIISKIKLKNDIENKFDLNKIFLRIVGVVSLLSWISSIIGGGVLLFPIFIIILGLILGVFLGETINRIKAGIEISILYYVAIPMMALKLIFTQGTYDEIRNDIKSNEIILKLFNLFMFFFGLGEYPGK